MQTITDQDNKMIAESFIAVAAALNHTTDNIKQSGADAMMTGDYNKVDTSKAAAMTLEKFFQEVTDLSTRWNNGIFNTPAPVTGQVATDSNRQGTRRKNTKTKLRVTFISNNKEIYRKTAIETFVETLRILKFDDVAKLNIRVSGYPLVSKTEFNQQPNRSEKCGDWHVTFPSNTQYKKSFLEDISKALKMPIRVDVI